MPYPPTIVEADLRDDIGEREFLLLKSQIEDTATAGPVGSIEAVIANQVARVLFYTKKYVLADTHFKDLTLKLVFWEAYAAAYPGGEVPGNRNDKYKAAMRELEAIRDNKFPDLQLADPLPDGVALNTGRGGSQPKLASRIFGSST